MTDHGVPDVAAVRARLDRVRERIAGAGGDPDRVELVAVTKGFGLSVVRAALGAGLVALGENYAQELIAKAAGVGETGSGAPVWHFLGRVQTNKVRHLAAHVTLWQSVDRVPLVHELARRAPGAAILVQINLSDDPHKGGCTFDEAPVLVHEASAAGLDVRGLMGVGTAGDPGRSRAGFERLVALADGMALPVRSIGMTDDLDIAVRAGSTMVRVGRVLFGERPPRGPHAPPGDST